MKRLYFLLGALLITATLSAQVLRDGHKMSPYLRHTVRKHHSLMTGIKDARGICLLMKCNGDAEKLLTRHGGTLLATIGEVQVAEVPMASVEALAAESEVQRLEAERMPRPAMRVTPGYVNATPVYQGTDLPQAYDGTGVVAGSVDVGHDFTHPSFLDADGKTRVKYFIDYNVKNSKGVWGKEYTTSDAIALVQHSKNIDLHGTHVLGIMGGSVVSQFRGMAPGADLCVADFNSDREDFESPDGGVTSARCILGFKSIFDYADAHNQPCVINFSSGESTTFTIGRTLEREALENMVGAGRIIVAAAGNEGDEYRYVVKPAGVNKTTVLMSGGLVDSEINADVRTDSDIDVIIKLGSTSFTFNTAEIKEAEGQYVSIEKLVNGTTVTISGERVDCEADSAGVVYTFRGAYPYSYYPYLNDCTITLEGEGEAELLSDFYVCPLSSAGSNNYLQEGYNVGWPGELDCIICVGSTNYSNGGGKLSYFSSVGPTLDNRFKPDVVAPGSYIISAANSFSSEGSSGNYSVTYNGKKYYFISLSGTSMASPVMAGTVALWLQACPTLTPEDVKTAIRATATHPDADMTYPNNQYGWGQVDVYNGLLHLLNVTGIAEPRPLSKELKMEWNGKTLTIDAEALRGHNYSMTVYDTKGQKLRELNGRSSLDLSTLPKGVYIVNLHADSKTLSGSTLIRVK